MILLKIIKEYEKLCEFHEKKILTLKKKNFFLLKEILRISKEEKSIKIVIPDLISFINDDYY